VTLIVWVWLSDFPSLGYLAVAAIVAETVASETDPAGVPRTSVIAVHPPITRTETESLLQASGS
jgi:hypothetical protein